jgi:hypothetical protein
MKRTLIALALIIFIASVSFASVPVARTDNFLEKLFLARYQEMQTWMQNVAYSISNPRTLGDLLALPNKLKGLTNSLKGITGFGDISGMVTGNLLRLGNNVLGELGDLGNFVKMQDIIRGDFSRTMSRLERAIKNIPIGGEGEEVTAEVAKTSTAAAIETAKTVPMSVPAVTAEVADQIITNSPSLVARQQNVIATASGAKMHLMEEYASFIARYDGKDSAHRKKVDSIIDQTQEVVESSKSYAQTVGKMEAQQAIARVGADQIALLALQNVLLANINNTLADEIVLLSKIGLAGTEEYAQNIRDILERHIEIYSGIRGE